MKKLLATMLALVMALTLCATAWADGLSYADNAAGGKTIDVGDYETLKQVMLDVNAGNVAGHLTVNITDDITCGADWTPGAMGIDFTINGNNHTITGLPGMLITRAHRKATIKDLTLSNVTVARVSTTDDDWECHGAFIGEGAYIETTLFQNCKLINSQIASAKYAGGFMGYIAADTNGQYTITFDNCTVKGCTITGFSSTGGIVGHALGNSSTSVVVTNATVTDNNITSNEPDPRGGAILGTVGADLQNKVSISATVSGNTVKANGADVDTIYGRRGADDCGTITLTGGSYDKQPLKDEDSWASVDSSIPEATVTNADGEPTSFNYGDSYVQSAAKNAAAGQTVTVTKGNVELAGIPAGVTVVVKETATATVNGVSVPEGNDGLTVYAVTFDSDGGTDVAAQNVAAGGKATQPANPTKNGYTFGYWCVESADGTHVEYDFDAPVNSNLELKAHWTVQSSGGTHHFNRPQPTTVTKAESPKTFDAGIAVYGVMTISSVLGMGYMGKKKV